MRLELKSIKKEFVSRSGCRYNCLEDLNMVIESGEFHLLYGASGSGKTTLLNIMAGMLHPTSGQVLLDGREIQNAKERELALLRRRRFGYAMQSASLLSSLTVYENIALPLTFFVGTESPAKAMQVTKPQATEEKATMQIETQIESQLRKAGLWKVKDSYPAELSGGEYRRCTILRAFITGPDFLLADEPTANLDDRNAEIIIEMLEELRKQGAAVVVATHDKRFADDSRRMWVLE